MQINGTSIDDGNLIHYVQLSEGDLYLLGFALNELREHSVSPELEAGASEMLRLIQDMAGEY